MDPTSTAAHVLFPDAAAPWSLNQSRGRKTLWLGTSLRFFMVSKTGAPPYPLQSSVINLSTRYEGTSAASVPFGLLIAGRARLYMTEGLRSDE
jgi:hypothetical protein